MEAEMKLFVKDMLLSVYNPLRFSHYKSYLS
jgi:hypothetical protein